MKKEKKQEKRPLSHLAFLLISLVLGLLVGFFIIFYLWQIGPASFFSFLRTDLDLNSPEYSNANVIIQEPKKVYVNQDIKINESSNYLSEAVFGVFAKDKKGTSSTYVLNEELFTGLVISSDGWLLINVLEQEKFDKNIVNKADSYIAISKKNKKMFEFEKMFFDEQNSLLFAKIKGAANLPVRNFVNIADLTPGQTLLAYNFSADVVLNSIKNFASGALVKSSDNFANYIEVNNPLPSSFKNSFVFDLNGDLIALVDANLKLRPVHDFRSSIFNFLDNKESLNFKYGISYTDLNDIFRADLPSHGALVTSVAKGSLAENAGILAGDVIVKINNYEVNTNLNNILNNFSLGDKLLISLWRDGSISDLRLELK